MSTGQSIVLCGLNARYVHSNLALRSLIAYVRTTWHDAPLVLVEGSINDQPLALLQKLYSHKASVYAFSCYIWNISLVRSLCRDLKKLLPASRIVWGGPEAGHDAKRWLMDEPAVDYIVRGEGEKSFADLLRVLQNEADDLSQVPGLSWRHFQNGLVQENPTGLLLPGSDWPFPYTMQDLAGLTGRILYYETSRGCPFSCSYCLSSLDRQVRFRPLDQTLAEIDRLLAANLMQVKLVDRTFNCDPDRAYAIWQHIIDRAGPQTRTNFHFEVAGDLLDDRTIDLLNLAPSGLIQLEIGVQTIHPDVLAAIGRKTNLDRLARQVGRLLQGGRVHLHLDLIAGLPGESLLRFGESLDYVWALRPHHLQLGFLKVLPGSPMADTARLLDFKWQEEPPYEILASDCLSFDDLILLKWVTSVLDMYTNSDFCRQAVLFLAARHDRAWLYLSGLAAWAGERGWLDRPLSPADRCRLLLEYADKSDPDLLKRDQGKAFKDMLRLDYQLSGQKDLPDCLRFDESGDPEAEEALLQARRLFKAHFPKMGRLRIDLLRFDLQHWLESGDLRPGYWAVCLDMSSNRPVMLDNCRVDDLYLIDL